MTLFISDLHRRFDSRYPFLEDLKDEALRYVLENYGNKSDYVVDAGDTFDKRMFDVELALRQVKIYRESLHAINRFYCLLGNHDARQRAVSPMSIFAEGTKCGKNSMTIVGKELVRVGPYVLRGWDSNFEFPQSDARYLVSHIRITEWAKSTEKAFTAAELDALPFERIICGDNHTSGEKGKTISIGTLCPSDFKDEGLEAGAVWFDEDHNSFQRIKIPNYPIFRKLVVTPETVEPDASRIKGNIVRLEFKGPQKWITDDLKRRWQLAIWAREPRSFEFGEDFYIGETRAQQAVSSLSVEQRYEATAAAFGWNELSAEIGRKALT